MKMKLDYNVCLNDIPAIKHRGARQDGEYRQIIETFLKSGKEVAMIQIPGSGEEFKRQKQMMQSSFGATIRKSKLPVMATLRGDKVYLVRKEAVSHVQ